MPPRTRQKPVRPVSPNIASSPQGASQSQRFGSFSSPAHSSSRIQRRGTPIPLQPSTPVRARRTKRMRMELQMSPTLRTPTRRRIRKRNSGRRYDDLPDLIDIDTEDEFEPEDTQLEEMDVDGTETMDEDEGVTDFRSLMDLEAQDEGSEGDRDARAATSGSVRVEVSWPASEEDVDPDLFDPETVVNAMSTESKQALIERLIGNDPELNKYVSLTRQEPATSSENVTSAPSATQKKQDKLHQQSIESALRPEDRQFDGTKNCLNSALWAPALRRMYIELEPPPKRVTYSACTNDAELVPPSFQKWTSCTEKLPMMFEVLRFRSNKHYVNPARARYSDLMMLDSGNVKTFRYMVRKGHNNAPAVFISLVEVVKCNLIRPVIMAKKLTDGWVCKKSLTANLFQQELELLIATLGNAMGVENVTLPSWTAKEISRGLSFQTRLSPSDGPSGTRGARSSLFTSTPVSAGQTQVQLAAVHNVPIIDARVDGFDLGSPLSDIRRTPGMEEDVPAGSLGAVFYTISDEGGDKPLNFNIQAFALLATSPESAKAGAGH